MAEVKTKPIELKEGETYTARAGDVVITDDHSFADIIRWLIDQGCDKKEAMWHYEEEGE